ncbi:hypothetical protein F4779DRAFT_588901 [Xylariaceae sp. FL0662B]|nr:hypothetical protein F4779DRAFT_588901 [Xylariaceae sp. FL0662B]
MAEIQTTPTPTPTPTSHYTNAGGFLPSTSLPSPSPSTASGRIAALLPRPRSKPLVPGSRKEDYARHYVEERLLHISRRFIKHHDVPDPADDVTGYPSMDEVCRDLEEVVDVLWFSGTPFLQIPYLLNIALAITTYLPSFPPSPRPTFALLRKLDHCFASLLVGHDVKSSKPLPGFHDGNNANHPAFTRTDMVRCKSLADETRMLVAVVMSNEPDVEDHPYADADEKDAAPLTTARRQPTPALPRQRHTGGTDNRVKTEEEFEVDIIDDWDAESSSDDEDSKPTSKHKLEPEPRSEPRSTHGTKRKVFTDTNAAAHRDTKRIKNEERDDLHERSPAVYSLEPGTEAATRPSILAPRPAIGEQFHWMVDSDDESEGEESLPNTSAQTQRAAQIAAAVQNGRDRINGDPDRGKKGHRGIEVDEDPSDAEEEELHLNVAKVYEKTLVQLGESLGESIIDKDID